MATVTIDGAEVETVDFKNMSLEDFIAITS